MPYNPMKELERVVNYYNQDPLQKRFSAIISGESNSGKTFLLHTARFPIHIDSFDPGGTKCLLPWIKKGDIVVDTQWENENPFTPTAFAEWMKTTNIRLESNYFDMFGTYSLDSLTTFGDAVMNYQLNMKNRAGETPQRNHDYMPQKVFIQNYIRKLMNLTCDFILTGHLNTIEDIISIDPKTGITRKNVKYRLNTTGRAVVALPLLFDELYVIVGKGEGKDGPKREMLIDSLGTYIARSRLKSDGKLSAIEEPNIKKLLKKVGLSWEDKLKLTSLAGG